MRLLTIALLLLISCSSPTEPEKPDRVIGVCEPRSECNYDGFAWIELDKHTDNAGCTTYQYACAKIGADPSNLCAEHWENSCD